MSQRLTSVAFVCTAVLGFSQGGKYAPLPQKITVARTAFIQNDSGEQGFADNVFRRLQEWGRWRIVTKREDADIVISLDHTDRLHNYFFLRVLDRESGETLWTARKDMAIRKWDRVARKLLEDLIKRLPSPSGTK